MDGWMDIVGRTVKLVKQVPLSPRISPKGKQFTLLVGYMP